MADIRRAVVFITAERTIAIVLNLLTLIIVARLLTPSEFGVVVLGLAVLGFGEILRDFGGTSYIISEERLTLAGIRTAFTLTLVFTLALSALTLALAGPAARFFDTPGLEAYLQVAAACFMLGPFVSPLYALMRREMRFSTIAAINVTTASVNAVAVVGLALAGASYMSFAWANLLSGAVGLLLGLVVRPDFSIYRPSLSEWRAAGNFARFETAASFLLKIREEYPFMVAGRLLGAEAVGLFQRSATLATLPDRVLLAAFGPIALPALAAAQREGRALDAAFLKAATLVTAVSWPALALLALLAYPVVYVLLGARWLDAVPLVGILAFVIALNFTGSLSRTVIIAAGHVRLMWFASLAIVLVALTVSSITGQMGLISLAQGLIVVAIVDLCISLWQVRHVTGLSLRNLAAALLPSAVVTLATLLPASLVVWILGGTEHNPVIVGIFAGLAGLFGWWKSLRLVGHPFWTEIEAGGRAVRKLPKLGPLLAGGRKVVLQAERALRRRRRAMRAFAAGPRPRAAAVWIRTSVDAARRRAYHLRRG